MCDESGGGGLGIGISLELFVGFVGRNAIPLVLAVPVAAVAILVVAHPVVVIACTVVAVLLATVGRVALSRLMLRKMGRLVAPAGFDRLKAREAAMKRDRAPVAEPEPVVVVPLAITNRAPLALDPPRRFVAGDVVGQDEPERSVVINGTRYAVLSKS